MRSTLKILMGFTLIVGLVFGQSYTEDFEDGDVSEWYQFRAGGEEMIQAVDMASAPAVLAGGGSKVGYIQDVDVSYSGASYLLLGEATDSNYTVESDVYIYNSLAGAITGIIAYADTVGSYPGGSGGYLVKLAADFQNSSTFPRFRIYNNKLDFTLPKFYTFYAEVDASTFDRTEGWHKMKISASTNSDGTVSYQCWYDDIDLGTYVDTAANHTTHGAAGVFSFHQTAGLAGYFDNFLVMPNDGTSIHNEGSLPVSMTLKQNFPNPFNPSTSISFDIHQDGDVALRVFNIKGERVTTLASGYIQPGSYELSWDGTDAAGQKVAAGTYMLVLSKGNEQLSKSMLLVK